MAKNTGGEGKGTTKPILSSDEQDKIRRDAKRRQRTHSRHDYQGSTSHPQITTGPRRTQISESEYNRVKFRLQQASKATEYPALKDIKPDTTEFRLFEAAVLAFPTVKVPVGFTRTKAAINACLPKLAGADVKNIAGRARGKQLIYQSLSWAFNELKKEEAKAAAETPERELASV